MRIALADDSLLFREGLARLLVEGGFEVAGQASDADRLLALVDSTVPDVAIVDIRMPPDHRDEGLTAARAIKEHHPGVGVLVLSQYVEPRLRPRARRRPPSRRRVPAQGPGGGPRHARRQHPQDRGR